MSRAPLWTIIDGHNLLFHVPAYKSLKRLNLTTAVAKLVADVDKLAGRAAGKYTLVFDGFAAGTEGAAARVEVLFSGKRTADDVIEALVRGAAAGSPIVVVTADVDHMNAVSRSGVSVKRPQVFAKELLEQMPGQAQPRKRLPLEDRLPQDVRDELERRRRG